MKEVTTRHALWSQVQNVDVAPLKDISFTFSPLFVHKLISTQFWHKLVLTNEKFAELGFKWTSFLG